MLRCNLPEQIDLKNATLKPVIGGHLEGVPFLKQATTNGWANGLHEIQINLSIISEAKRRGLKYRIVHVLSRNLRNKTDLHGMKYQPNSYVFVQTSN